MNTFSSCLFFCSFLVLLTGRVLGFFFLPFIIKYWLASIPESKRSELNQCAVLHQSPYSLSATNSLYFLYLRASLPIPLFWFCSAGNGTQSLCMPGNCNSGVYWLGSAHLKALRTKFQGQTSHLKTWSDSCVLWRGLKFCIPNNLPGELLLECPRTAH